MASALAAAGAKVALTGRSAARAAAVAAALPGAAGVEMDARAEAPVARAGGQAGVVAGGRHRHAGEQRRDRHAHGQPAVHGPPAGFLWVPVDGFRAVIETNLTGYFLVAREITPRMLTAGGGRIVNISVNIP